MSWEVCNDRFIYVNSLYNPPVPIIYAAFFIWWCVLFPHHISAVNQNNIAEGVCYFWKFEKYGVNEVKSCRKGGHGFLIKTDCCLESWTPSLFSHTMTLAKSLEYFHRWSLIVCFLEDLLWELWFRFSKVLVKVPGILRCLWGQRPACIIHSIQLRDNLKKKSFH